MTRGSVLGVFLFGTTVFASGAAVLWGVAGFAMAVGLVFVLMVHAALTIRGRSWDDTARQAWIEAAKRDRQVAETVKVGDRIELHSYIQQPIQWEPVEVIAILPRARDGHVMVQVRHAGGTESAQSLNRLWRTPSSDTWRPLTS